MNIEHASLSTQSSFWVYSPNWMWFNKKDTNFWSPSNQMCSCLFFCAHVVSFHWGLLGDAGAWTECTLNLLSQGQICCQLKPLLLQDVLKAGLLGMSLNDQNPYLKKKKNIKDFCMSWYLCSLWVLQRCISLACLLWPVMHFAYSLFVLGELLLY